MAAERLSLLENNQDISGNIDLTQKESWSAKNIDRIAEHYGCSPEDERFQEIFKEMVDVVNKATITNYFDIVFWQMLGSSDLLRRR